MLHTLSAFNFELGSVYITILGISKLLRFIPTDEYLESIVGLESKARSYVRVTKGKLGQLSPGAPVGCVRSAGLKRERGRGKEKRGVSFPTVWPSYKLHGNCAFCSALARLNQSLPM
jgi:hypothetical protein